MKKPKSICQYSVESALASLHGCIPSPYGFIRPVLARRAAMKRISYLRCERNETQAGNETPQINNGVSHLGAT